MTLLCDEMSFSSSSEERDGRWSLLFENIISGGFFEFVVVRSIKEIQIPVNVVLG